MAATSTYDFWYESTSLDSMEGVPEWPRPGEKILQPGASPVERVHAAFAWLGGVLPGIGLAFGLAVAGKYIADWLGIDVLRFKKSPVSEITVAVILGLIIRNTIGLPVVYEKGLRLAGREILRFGIVLIGLRLSLAAVGRLGLAALPVIAGCITAALIIVTWINRALGLPRRLGSLIAVGTSICGVSAIAATAPLIDAEEDEVSYSVACITLFGLLALFCYPFLSHSLFRGDVKQAGLFLGTAIHDTSQVAGAGVMYVKQYQPEAESDPKIETALDVAAVTKLTRNVCMAAVIPLVGFLYHRHGTGSRGRLRLAQAVPLFVLGFLLAAAVRTIGDIGDRPFGWFAKPDWKELLTRADILAVWCLTVAMAAVGLGTGLNRIRRLGWKSFAVGLLAAVIVGSVAAGLIFALGPYLGTGG
jgi:uncharacterized integral membrane protein (TIGR00698 family)